MNIDVIVMLIRETNIFNARGTSIFLGIKTNKKNNKTNN